MPTKAHPTPALTDPSMIDRLVREVIRRLMASTNGETETIDEKVVSVTTIENIPEAKKRISIRPGTIVTPAARDEAKKRSITITHTTTRETEQQPTTTTDSAIVDTANPERAESLVAQLRRRGIASPSTQIILSETPARDVYEQCSRHGQRGVMVMSIADVDRFAVELSPTAWVLDMTRLNLIAATNIVAKIAQQHS